MDKSLLDKASDALKRLQITLFRCMQGRGLSTTKHHSPSATNLRTLSKSQMKNEEKLKIMEHNQQSYPLMLASL